MTQQDERERQIASLRERLSRLSEASLRNNENLDVEAALQAVMEGAPGRPTPSSPRWTGRAESEGLGMGARFAFTLPAVVEAASESVRPVPGIRPHGATGQPILLVDDDPETLRYVRRTLSDAG